jgi:heme A synthase
VPWLLAAPLAGTLLTGTSGAVAALGDTLFPARTLAEGFAADWSATAHVFVRLRALHPLFAVLTAAAAILSVVLVRALRPSPRVKRLGVLVIAGYSAQVGLGLLNLALLAPIAMQLTHLLAADAAWLLLVIFAAAALEDREVSAKRLSHGEDAAPERVAPA